MDSVLLKGWWPRADRDGRVYVPYTEIITMFTTNDTGNATVVGRLTAGGKLHGYPHVALGPQLGELTMHAVGQHNSQNVYIINKGNDSVVHTLKLPDGMFGVWSLATQQDTGQILIGSPQGVVLFKSVSERPRLFTNTPITQEEALVW